MYPVYITKTKNRQYLVKKETKNIDCYCGVYVRLDEAEYIRDCMVKCDWDMRKLNKFRSDIGYGRIRSHRKKNKVYKLMM